MRLSFTEELAQLEASLQEEGDLRRSAELEAESVAAYGAQVSLLPSHSEVAEAAWVTGDWVTLLRAAEEYLERWTAFFAGVLGGAR